MKPRNLSLPGAVVALVAAATLSGCSSSSDADSSGSGLTSTAEGTPIKIGFLNQGAGAMALADFGAGGTVGAEQVNADGGINGHPIDLEVCNVDGTPAASVKCANQFVANDVVAVVQGIDLSSDSALEILAGAGIPFVGHTPFGAVQSDSPDAWFFGVAPGANYGVPLQTLKEEYDASSVAFINPDSPVTRAVADANLIPVAEKLDLELTTNFYNAASPNYSSVFASAVADDPDAVFMIAPEADCTGFVQAGRALGYDGKIFAGSCSQFVTADPGSAEGVLTSSDVYLTDDTSTLPDLVAEQIDTYSSAMSGQPASNINGFSQMTFSAMQDLAAVARTINGDVTSESLRTALQEVAGMDSFMGQPLTCDGKQWPNSISVCAPGLLVYEVKDGKRQLISDGFVNIAPLFES